MTNVSSEADLQAMYLDATDNYTLTADITCTTDFTPYMVTSYSGTFDGANHTITDFTITTGTTAQCGLFKGTLNTAIIKDVTLSNVSCTSASGGNYFGALVGYNYATVSGVNISGTINYTAGTSAYVGSLIGRHRGTNGIDDCHFTSGSVSGDSQTGGLIGHCTENASVTNCSSSGSVTGSNTTGGLIGAHTDSTDSMTNCHYYGGTVTGSNNTGGLIGTGTSEYTNCTSSGTVVGSSNYCGGLIGLMNGGATNCSSSCTVNGEVYTGGFVGRMNPAFATSCYATGNVTGTGTTGGFCGLNSGNMTNCYATGTVSGTGGTFGGFCGGSNTSGTISGCYATGSVSTNDANVGGLCGYSQRPIEKSYATGNVTATGAVNYTGGLVGNSSVAGTITDCYSTGNVSGYNYVGGISGRSYLLVTRCYATGDVDGNASVGGVIGQCENNLYNSWASGDITGSSNVGGVIGRLVGSESDNGWWTGSSTTYAIGDTSGSVDYETATLTDFYDKTQNTYDTGTYTWDFATPVWYEWSTDYPKFTAQPVVVSGTNALFFGHF